MFLNLYNYYLYILIEKVSKNFQKYKIEESLENKALCAKS
jgi:hypothetical protein